jgi:hypothetical protein
VWRALLSLKFQSDTADRQAGKEQWLSLASSSEKKKKKKIR